MSDVIPEKHMWPITGGIPIVVAVENNPVAPGQQIEITVGIGGYYQPVQVTLTCVPDVLDGMGTFTQNHAAQQYNAFVRKEATEPFIVTATTSKGSLSSESVVVLADTAVIDS